MLRSFYIYFFEIKLRIAILFTEQKRASFLIGTLFIHYPSIGCPSHYCWYLVVASLCTLRIAAGIFAFRLMGCAE